MNRGRGTSKGGAEAGRERDRWSDGDQSGRNSGNRTSKSRTNREIEGNDADDASNNIPVRGAVVEAIEAHARKPHMYRIVLKLEWDETSLGDEALRANDSHETAKESDQLAAEWNDEVDALISGAKSTRKQEDSYLLGGKSDRTQEVPLNSGAKNARREGEVTLTVHEDTLISWRLLKGRRLTSEEYETLKLDEQKEEAYRSALVMLEFKARTTAELSRGLKRKGYAPEIVSACVERLKLRRMVDDAAYAKRFTEQRATGQRKGRMLIRQELLQRGVERADVEQALDELDSDIELAAAVALAHKKWPGTKGNDRERKMKLMGMLLRRGYASGIARTAVQQAAERSGEADPGEDEDEGYAYDPDLMEE